jgi:hypothetical protein
MHPSILRAVPRVARAVAAPRFQVVKRGGYGVRAFSQGVALRTNPAAADKSAESGSHGHEESFEEFSARYGHTTQFNGGRAAGADLGRVAEVAPEGEG